ncbi:hypothetical protein SIIN_7171_T [Serendipita indica DSM 11827]|nr:hypothetical protein SIIN_7171_T [Serendipita indica DSM 11827]
MSFINASSNSTANSDTGSTLTQEATPTGSTAANRSNNPTSSTSAASSASTGQNPTTEFVLPSWDDTSQYGHCSIRGLF